MTDTSGAQGYLLLALNNVRATLPSNTSITGRLALECITLPVPPSLPGSGKDDRDVWLLVRIGLHHEFAISPTHIITHDCASRTFTFEGAERGGGTWSIQVPEPHDLTEREDLETFEVLLSQYAAVHEEDSVAKAMAEYDPAAARTSAIGLGPPPPTLPGRSRSVSPQLPPTASSPTSASTPPKGGQLVLVDEEDGSVVGTLCDDFHITEDPSVRAPGNEKDPVIVDMNASGGGHDLYVQAAGPAYQDGDWVMRGASVLSHGIVLATSAVSSTLSFASRYYIAHSTPSDTPLEFSERTNSTVKHIHGISGKAVVVTAKTTRVINDLVEGTMRRIAGRKAVAGGTPAPASVATPPPVGGSRSTTSLPPPPYSQSPSASLATPQPKLPLLNRVLLSTDMLLTTLENSGKHLIEHGTETVGEVVDHKYGNAAGSHTRMVGHTLRNVGVVYVDARGVGRRALLKRAGKTLVKAKLGKNEVVLGAGAGDELQAAPPSLKSKSS